MKNKIYNLKKLSKIIEKEKKKIKKDCSLPWSF